MQQLPATVAQAASATLSPAFAQMLEQVPAPLLICVDVPIDPFMTGQARTADDLLGTEVFGQQGFDLADALAVDARTPAGMAAALPVLALGLLRVIALGVAIAPQLPADGIGRTTQGLRNVANR